MVIGTVMLTGGQPGCSQLLYIYPHRSVLVFQQSQQLLKLFVQSQRIHILRFDLFGSKSRLMRYLFYLFDGHQ